MRDFIQYSIHCLGKTGCHSRRSSFRWRSVEPSAAAKNKSAPTADEGGSMFPGMGGVAEVAPTCCGGVATKSRICVIQ